MVQTGSKLINKQLSYELPQMRSISEVQTQDHFIWRKGIHSGDKETTYFQNQLIATPTGRCFEALPMCQHTNPVFLKLSNLYENEVQSS